MSWCDESCNYFCSHLAIMIDHVTALGLDMRSNYSYNHLPALLTCVWQGYIWQRKILHDYAYICKAMHLGELYTKARQGVFCYWVVAFDLYLGVKSAHLELIFLRWCFVVFRTSFHWFECSIFFLYFCIYLRLFWRFSIFLLSIIALRI